MNKIIVNTNLQDLMELIKHIANITHMKIITDVANQTGSDFMAANLYVHFFLLQNVRFTFRHDLFLARIFC